MLIFTNFFSCSTLDQPEGLYGIYEILLSSFILFCRWRDSRAAKGDGL